MENQFVTEINNIVSKIINDINTDTLDEEFAENSVTRTYICDESYVNIVKAYLTKNMIVNNLDFNMNTINTYVTNMIENKMSEYVNVVNTKVNNYGTESYTGSKITVKYNYY